MRGLGKKRGLYH